MERKRHKLSVRTYPALLVFIGFGKHQKSGIKFADAGN
jgi:hypothetical protein